jgi:hypothetical protein
MKVRFMGFCLSNLLSDRHDDRDYLETESPTVTEVAGAIDAFVSLEEIAPDLDWMEALAATWGMPCPESAKLASKDLF